MRTLLPLTGTLLLVAGVALLAIGVMSGLTYGVDPAWTDFYFTCGFTSVGVSVVTYIWYGVLLMRADVP